MNADERGSFDSLTEHVLGAIFEVANTLGAGFLEKVYERALLKELSICGMVNFRRPTVEWKRVVHRFQPLDSVRASSP